MTIPFAAIAGSTPMSLAAVFMALASELDLARAHAAQVEAAVCQMAGQSEVGARLLGDLQHLDLVMQHLSALRDFAASLAASADPAASICIADGEGRISLDDVRRRLNGHARQDGLGHLDLEIF